MEKDLDNLKVYLEEIQLLPKVEDSTLEEMIRSFNSGETKLKGQIMQAFLLKSVQIAAEYKNQGIPLLDLIQEANIGLMKAFHESEKTLTKDFIQSQIREAVENAIHIEEIEKEAERRVLDRVNQLNEACRELAEQRGREANVQELAEYLNLTEEEIKDYMKLSLDAVQIP